MKRLKPKSVRRFFFALIRRCSVMSLSAEITLLLDGQPHHVPAGSTLAGLVQALGHAPEGIATAVNAQFVPRSARASLQLREGDQVMLFQPIVGG